MPNPFMMQRIDVWVFNEVHDLFGVAVSAAGPARGAGSLRGVRHGYLVRGAVRHGVDAGRRAVLPLASAPRSRGAG